MKKLLFAFSAVVLLVACGGGGGGGGGSSSDTGTGTGTGVATTQAVITSSNASTMATQSSTLLTQAQSISVAFIPASKPILKSSLKEALKPQGGANGSDDTFARLVADAMATLDAPRSSYTGQGSCGGSMTIDSTGTATNPDVSIVFANYNDCVSTADGLLRVTGTRTSFSMTMDLTITRGSDTATMKGAFSGSGSSTSVSITMTLEVSGTTSGTPYYAKIENYVMNYTLTSTAYTLDLSGRFYYDKTGYVDLWTPVLLSGTAAGNRPTSVITSGEIRMQGSNGFIKCVYTAGTAAYFYSLDGGATWIAIT